MSDTFCIELNDPDQEEIDEFTAFMTEYQNSLTEHIECLAKELNVSYGCACNIFRLREKSCWTQEAEDKLIAKGVVANQK